MIWFYWGNARMSFLRYMSVHSACAFNPEVTLVLGGSGFSGSWKEQQDMQYYEGPDYTSWLDGLSNLNRMRLEDLFPEIAAKKAPEIHTSDLFSWDVLWSYGGTVADMDIVFVAPAPEVDDEVQLVQFETGYIPVSFMQGKPCAFWGAQFGKALRSYDPTVYESCGSSVLDRIGDFKKLPPNTVFPFHKLKWKAMMAALFRQKKLLPSDCVGVHWYAGANRKFNEAINHRNFREFDCTVTEAVGRSYDAS